MVKTAAGIADDDPLDDALEKLRDCCPDEAVADLLALASGVLEAVKGERNQQEIAWAAREWAEKLAEPQPLVLVFEDIHWAEDALLELVEHMSTWVKTFRSCCCAWHGPSCWTCVPAGAAAVCARRRSSWSRWAAPTARHSSRRSLDGELGSGARQAVLEKSEGNPLFVEETVRMLSEANGGGIERIPDTLQALIAARIDHLPPGEKELLQGAAVDGEDLLEGALDELVLEGTDIDPLLEDLHLREFVLPETRSSISGEDAFKFKHVLIREVAYGGLSKAARAGYHQRFAEWLRKRAGEELLEVRAYHLDHATALLAELDGRRPRSSRRGRRGAGRGRPSGARTRGERDGAQAPRPGRRARADPRAAVSGRPGSLADE